MQYISTRDREQQFSASQAIAKGLADDGGLLTPVYLPKLPRRALEELKDMSYQQRAVYVMKLFLDEFTVKELTDFANAAYGPEKFDTPAVAPVRAPWTATPSAWSCGTAPPAPLRTWPCRCCPICSLPLCASRRRRSCLLYTSPSPRDRQKSRMPSSA